MKVSTVILFFSLLSGEALAGKNCGSKEGYLNSLASSFLIPDYFPPETDVLKGLVSEADYKRCAKIGFTDLGQHCVTHDSCYDLQLDKDLCDAELQDSWVKQCRKQYYKFTADHFICRLSCEAFVKLMSEAQKYNEGDFCPSCDAYESAK